MNFKSAILLATLVSVMPTTTTAREAKHLYLYTWDTYADTVLFHKFTTQTGIEVITEIYSTNDALLAKLLSGASYDVVMPSGTFIQPLISLNLLRPLPARIRAYHQHLVPIAQKPSYDPLHEFSFPVFVGTTGITVNRKLYSKPLSSWQELFRRPPGEAAQIGMIDDIGSIMNVLSLSLNRPYCEAQSSTYQNMYALLAGQKPFVKVYGATGYGERMIANEVAMQLSWSSDSYIARQANPHLAFVHPREGVEAWVDNLVLAERGKNHENSVRFIEFLLQPENAAELAVYVGNLSTIAAANKRLPESLRLAPELNVPAGVPVQFAQSCPLAVLRKYNKVWERLMR